MYVPSDDVKRDHSGVLFRTFLPQMIVICGCECETNKWYSDLSPSLSPDRGWLKTNKRNLVPSTEYQFNQRVFKMGQRRYYLGIWHFDWRWWKSYNERSITCLWYCENTGTEVVQSIWKIYMCVKTCMILLTFRCYAAGAVLAVLMSLYSKASFWANVHWSFTSCVK